MICCVQVSSFALSSLSLKGWECECECECPPRRCWPFRCLPGCPRSDVTPVHPLFRNAYNNGRSRSGYNRKGIRPWNAVSLLSPINRNYSIKKKSEVHPVLLKYIFQNGIWLFRLRCLWQGESARGKWIHKIQQEKWNFGLNYWITFYPLQLWGDFAEKGFEDKSKKICNWFFEQLVIWSCSNLKSVILNHTGGVHNIRMLMTLMPIFYYWGCEFIVGYAWQ